MPPILFFNRQIPRKLPLFVVAVVAVVVFYEVSNSIHGQPKPSPVPLSPS